MRFIENKGETVAGFAVFRTVAYWVLMGQKVRFPSDAPLLDPSFLTVYSFNVEVGILVERLDHICRCHAKELTRA